MTNSWTQTADLGTDTRRQAMAFTIGGQAYVGGGVDFTINFNDFNRYDPVADDWTVVAPFPLPVRKNSAAFSIGGMAYLVGGNGQSPILNEVWSFTPDTITTGLGTIRANTFSVFPDPVETVLHMGATTTGTYRLLSSTGELLHWGSLNNGTIAVENLAPGLYILELDYGNDVRRAHFVKK
ncbi:MAG: hypothetical protein IPL86_02645 [Flavobacteriales bacterium]|nr:hypothetical protein [Flavobacteriales bacterium]